MIAPRSPQEIQELAAGYVLGDLTSAEAEAFQVLLAEMPDLQAEVSALQEALSMMPYGLENVAPAVELRSQILSVAQAEVLQPAPSVLADLSVTSDLPAPSAQGRISGNRPASPKKSARWRLTWTVGTLAAGLAIAWGLTWRSGQVPQLAQAPPSAELAGGMHQTWSGLSQLLNDHQRSLANPEGPVDFVVQQPADIPSLLKGFKTTVAALPILPPKQGMLLGGSNCQLGETPGLRLTYQLDSEQTVSAYQLALADEEFPEFQAAQLTLQQSDGTGIVLWRDDNYLYALVAEMPTAELQSLAYAITGT